MTNLNTIYALRQHNLMTAGALYALGHDNLAARAEGTFPAVSTLRNRLNEMGKAIDRDFGGIFDAVVAPIPEERTREYHEVRGWLDAALADETAIIGEIDAIIDALYDDATIRAEEGALP